MCLIIHKKPEQTLSYEFLRDVYNNNKDGWGIMWYNRRGKPAIVKGLEFVTFLEKYEKLKRKELMIHFRMATDGAVTEENAHPYHVFGSVYMMHNGILHKYRTDRQADISDSKNFLEKEVRPLLEEHGEDYVNSPAFLKEMEKHTGSTNKLVFITKNGYVIPDKQFWKETLSGVIVSNEYAYTVDNPSTYGRWGWSEPKRYTKFQSGTGNYPNVETGDDTPWDSCDTSQYGTKRVTLVADNTKKVAVSRSIHDMTDEELREYDEAINGGSDLVYEDYSWLEDMSEDDIKDIITESPCITAKVIKTMLQEIADLRAENDYITRVG